MRILQPKKWAAAVYVIIIFCYLLLHVSAPQAQEREMIRIGALVDIDSAIGPSAKEAIELAIADINQHINKNFSWLNGSHLSLLMVDTKKTAFEAAAAAMEILKEEVVAIVGPQSTTGSHFIAHMCTTLQVPVVSYGATDPALSEHQYPFFLRLSHNDVFQMRAVADLIKYYGWRTVVALYTDDDYGANGITALEDALMQQVSPSMFRKERLPPVVERNGIGSILSRLAMMESRIFVVHMRESIGLRVFAEAEYLGMMNTGFVWIVTDLLAYSVEKLMQRGDMRVVRATQGVIGMRRYIPPSPKLQEVSKKWERLSSNNPRLLWDDLNVYAMCAYDAIWLIAEALRTHLQEGGHLTFENQATMKGDEGGGAELRKLRVLTEGEDVRNAMVRTRLNGTIGRVELDAKGDMQAVPFEIVNAVGRGMRVIGYWQDDNGITALPPDLTTTILHGSAINGSMVEHEMEELDHRAPYTNQHAREGAVRLPDVVWPGGGIQVPRGWVIPQNGKPLMIGVPKKAGYKELIRQTTDVNTNVTTYHGFCINVFEAAIRYLPYAVTFQFVTATGMDNSAPRYDDLIVRLANQEFDAVVGDATITKRRLDLVDFTQPYIESGLEIVVPLINRRPHNQWAFLQPFTPMLWFTIGVFFLFTGGAIWMLEHRLNYAFRGRFRKQVFNSLWFIFSTLFFAQRERTKSVLGRCVLIIWLFVVLIITSSYTASLTSILTVQQLSPSLPGIHSLLESDVPIGYQMGSFVRDYLMELGIKAERLVPLNSKTMYAKFLRLGPDNGGVAAIVDELPYVQLFLASEGKTEFTTAGQEFTKSGWAFAFPKNSQITADVSEAILRMSENGELQKIHNLWFNTQEKKVNDGDVDSSQLDMMPFSGLFMISGLVSVSCLVAYLVRLLNEFRKSRAWNGATISNTSSLSRSAQFIKSFALYLDEHVDGEHGQSTKESKEAATSHILDVSPVSSLER